jgi:transposase
MRGDDQQQNHVFSYLSPEMRVRKDHPLRAIRTMVDEVLTQLSLRLDAMYSRVGRPSIAPEKLLWAQLLQMLYSIRSERLLMEEMDYNLLFRWFVGLNADDDVWDPTVFTKNRDRLLEADVAKEFLARVVISGSSRQLGLLCLDDARKIRSIPEPAATRPARKCRRAIACVVRIQSDNPECARLPPVG